MSRPNPQNKLISALQASVDALSKRVDRISKAMDANGDSSDQKAPPKIAIVELPPAIADHYESKNQEKKTFWGWANNNAGVFGLIISIITFYFTYTALQESQRQSAAATEQTHILRRQMELQGARILFEPIRSDGIQPPPSLGFAANFTNEGVFPATNFSATIELSRQSYPEGRVLHSDTSYWAFPLVKAQPDIQLHLKNYSAEEALRISRGEEIVLMQGSYTYNNGFHNVEPIRFCYIYALLPAREAYPNPHLDLRTCEISRQQLDAARTRKQQESQPFTPPH